MYTRENLLKFNGLVDTDLCLNWNVNSENGSNFMLTCLSAVSKLKVFIYISLLTLARMLLSLSNQINYKMYENHAYQRWIILIQNFFLLQEIIHTTAEQSTPVTILVHFLISSWYCTSFFVESKHINKYVFFFLIPKTNITQRIFKQLYQPPLS